MDVRAYNFDGSQMRPAGVTMKGDRECATYLRMQYWHVWSGDRWRPTWQPAACIYKHAAITAGPYDPFGLFGEEIWLVPSATVASHMRVEDKPLADVDDIPTPPTPR